MNLILVVLIGLSLMALLFTQILSKKPPTPVEEESTLCHYCGQKILDQATIQRRCPNCNETALFHGIFCGTHLREVQPRCEGVFVGHDSGHRISLKYPNLCASCGLGKEYWNEWHCAPNVIELNRKLCFTDYDVVWLQSLGISVSNEEPVTKG
jgi:predicted RNA-binding Zn-ribbon protein involved in translation (DUF1610 family)